MTTYKGSTVLLKAGDDGGPETFATIGSLRITDLAVNRQALDSSNLASSRWRTLIAGGPLSLRIGGQGIYTSDSAERLTVSRVFSGTTANYTLNFPDSSIIAAAFIISDYKSHAAVDDAIHYELTLESAGAVTYTPPA